MRKLLRIFAFVLLAIILFAFGGIALLLYDKGEGFDTFETEAVNLPEDLNGPAILVFSKTNGFRHGSAIKAALPIYRNIARENGWSIYETEDAGVFNRDQLSRFQLVIWNNVTGKVLTEEQRTIFRSYIEEGGGFMGIHGAGDGSHQWEWYENEVLRAHFSHHNIALELDTATLHLEIDSMHLDLCSGLISPFEHKDEWYVFYDNPRKNGSTVLYTADENTFSTSGNIKFFVKDKDFGMGEDHPIVWYHELAGGRVFYSALGHHAGAFADPNYQKIIANAMQWAGDFE